MGTGERGVWLGAIPASHPDAGHETRRSPGRPQALIKAGKDCVRHPFARPGLSLLIYNIFFFCNLASVEKNIFSRLLIVYLKQL